MRVHGIDSRESPGKISQPNELIVRKYAIVTVRMDLDCLVVIITAQIFPLSNSFVKMMQPANLGYRDDFALFRFFKYLVEVENFFLGINVFCSCCSIQHTHP